MHKIIAVDESGDPDKTEKSTHFFVLGIFIYLDTFLIKKILRKTKNKFKLGNKKTGYIFHANKDSPKIKKYLLSQIVEQDLELHALIFDKNKIKDLDILKAFDCLNEHFKSENIYNLVFAQRETSKYKNSLILERVKDLNPKMSRPNKEESLQVSDIISWSIFQKYENGNLEYYDIIKDKIKVKEI